MEIEVAAEAKDKRLNQLVALTVVVMSIFMGLAQVKDRDEVMLVSNGGMLIRIKVHDISVIGRNTQGVRLISLDSAGEKVSGISKLPEATDENGDTGAGEEGPSGTEPQSTEPPGSGPTDGES